jgi:HEAT repeat protein
MRTRLGGLVLVAALALARGPVAVQAADEKEPEIRGKPASAWIEQLKKGNVVQRQNAAVYLGMAKPATKAIVAALADALKDPEAEVRRTAASWLGNAETAAEPAVPQLLGRLKDAEEDPGVRAISAASLSKIAPKDKDVAAAVGEAVKDKNPRIRAYAALALSRIDPENAKMAVGTLLEILESSKDPQIRFSVIDCLGDVGPKAKDAVPVLLGLIKAGGRDSTGARYALQKIDPDALKK